LEKIHCKSKNTIMIFIATLIGEAERF